MSIHEQVDTGLGFTCDAKIVGVIKAFNRLPGLRSFCSCEEGASLGGIWIEFDADSASALENLRDCVLNSKQVFSLTFGVGGFTKEKEFSLRVWHGNLCFVSNSDPEVIENALIGPLPKYVDVP